LHELLFQSCRKALETITALKSFAGTVKADAFVWQ
jgi:hypothetical protein